MTKAITPHDAVLDALLSDEEKVEHDAKVRELLVRNAMLKAIDMAREQKGLSKAELARTAEMESSSLRRMLTSDDANPTLDNIARLVSALELKIDATLPSGERVGISS